MAAPSDHREAGLTGAQRAVSALREGVRSGRYVPGQRLVEADLTRELGVGRNSLREAFSRLRSEGLVTLEPHRGASVRRLTRDEVAGLYDLSEVLEGLAARRAAEAVEAPGHRDRLDAAVAGIEAVPADDVVGAVDESARFHRTVVELSGNARLIELIEQLHIQTFSGQLRHAGRSGLAGMRDRAVAEHLELAAAIGQGDASRAEQLMRTHITNARDRFLALPDSDFAP